MLFWRQSSQLRWQLSLEVTRRLELELIQPHMAQKPVLRGEVGARALRVQSVSREDTWASAGVHGAWVGRWVWVWV